MGYKVAIRNIETGEQRFLSGHTNNVSTLCVSPCGEYVASGQNNHLGFKAMVIVWNYKEGTIKGSYETHKVGIVDLCFTRNSDFLVSLGGRDDGNVVIWDVQKNSLICGSFASNDTSGNAYNVTRTHLHGECFITSGDRTLKIWRIEAEKRRIHGLDVEVGKLKRLINCVAVDEMDEIIYCGTSSGDIIKARLNLRDDLQCGEPMRLPVMIGCYSKITRDPRKMKVGEGDLYAGGVRCLLLLKDEKLVVGTGDGTIELIQIIICKKENRSHKPSKFPNTPQILTHQKETVCSAVTSMVLHLNEFLLVGTSWCEIYQIQLSNFHMRLLVTCHTNCIYSIAFPRNHSEIFATGSKNDVRLWKLEKQKEIVRITVANFICSSLQFARNDQMLLSAWNDGIIRAFSPHNGEFYFSIYNAHTKAVSTITVTSDDSTMISGGCDGQVRVWDIKTDVRRLISVLKEHRSPITSLHISSNNEDLISSSTDGTCVIWDIIRCTRKHILMGNTMFMMAQFTPDGIQILTCGTDRKIAYWETLDGSLVREIEGSSAGTMNCLDISPDGRRFITGSNDCTVKSWEYDSADVTHISTFHAAIITACKFSTDGKHIVTASADGTIMIWKYPSETLEDSKSVDRSGRAANSIRSMPDEDVDKLFQQKAEDDGKNVVAEDQTVRSSKKSTSSCTSDQKPLSVASDRSKGSKKETRKEERTPVCKCASRSSVSSKSSAGTPNRCRCKDTKSDRSSKARTMEKLKESSNSSSRRSITSKT
ncbi:cilia- and flagella-associated protein 52 [Solenopsis invicta]|uniref:cilia- and flagella-associated protein 52 n=1 Tax=Solenopsis invicta TaxID=13686 RepID=UPI00193DB5C7|nr:cilia- and flagella-associated protein 52 [Solenopsis invicta]XP_039306087.1 cilia- and flagella-associated protein 52 [Solenopsis invicta]XP_039306088.1 cilia- and flagella-associated protein 52 [Solenopsis invicta]XP_039306089.1 cilia- and flagella-associated protein 52 [Solenopsis invicta]XP_039306090.1 cilia- and flagella-associated protein 52 [Solenopsis invicta]XP_039306091.1 cilia- and flagella-associated protein 52 [Solenopsis invicta]XP_039306093.1 cilia- and flagella-associated p